MSYRPFGLRRLIASNPKSYIDSKCSLAKHLLATQRRITTSQLQKQQVLQAEASSKNKALDGDIGGPILSALDLVEKLFDANVRREWEENLQYINQKRTRKQIGSKYLVLMFWYGILTYSSKLWTSYIPALQI